MMITFLNRNCKRLLLIIGLAAILLPGCKKVETTINNPVSKMNWWHKAKFGMFIHWGVYSVPAGMYNGQPVGGLGEWIMQNANIPRSDYKSFASQFNPVGYDPDAWAKMAKDAGMKYIVITAKHHDGFALFNSQASDWNVVKATPYGKDLLAPLADACRKYGIKLGFYYSQANDWYNPGGATPYGNWDPTQSGDMDDYLTNIAFPQVKELMSNYGDVAELWWDFPTNMNYARATKFNELLQQYPSVVLNDRLGGNYTGDFTTPEQMIPVIGIPGGRDWEVCMTMNDTWGYKTNDNNWKNPTALITNLVDIASKGGNYLLNVGPTGNGEFPLPAKERLQFIGDWLKKNGAAIYGTTAGPFRKISWGRCTQKLHSNSATLYFPVFNWPADGKLLLPGLTNKISSCKFLVNNSPVTTENTADGVLLHIPAIAPDPVVPVIEVETIGLPDVKPIVINPAADGTIYLQAEDVTIHNNTTGTYIFVEGEIIKDIGYWGDPYDWISWDLNITRPGTYTIKAMIGTPASSSSFFINIANKQLDGVATSSGGYYEYTEQTLNSITITNPGKYTLAIHPNPLFWLPININQVKLIP